MNKEGQCDVLYPILNAISPLPQEVWEKAKPYFKTKDLKPGEHLFCVGDKVEDFYFLILGLARYYYLTENGKEFNKSFAEKSGHLLSSIVSVSKGEPSPFSVEILSDFTTLYISYQDFLSLGLQYSEWNRLHLRIFENLIVKKERREADFLLLNATQRYEKFLNEYSMISHVVPNYHIASYLGITEVALSRIRKKMKLT
ncbi:MAG: Crp/Fnr family transcriptional regulator [Sulfurospirillaceae bacterium]|nr:Crp/Fnr family transcriptional regulator [Sulfurospirillaceae bacterium]